MNNLERTEIENLKVGDVKWFDNFSGEWMELNGEEVAT